MGVRADPGVVPHGRPRAVSSCAHGAAPPVGTVGITLDDARVAAAVRSALLADPDLGLRAITVDVDRGVVSLSGVVRTEEEVRARQR